MTSALVFDFGERRIGIACANRLTNTASPLTTLLAKAGVPQWLELDRLVKEWAPDVLVVGLPQHAAGGDSPMTGRVREFARTLAERYQRPLETVDERFTSTEATDLLRETRRRGLKARRVRKEDVDSLAATLIAESWLQRG